MKAIKKISLIVALIGLLIINLIILPVESKASKPPSGGYCKFAPGFCCYFEGYVWEDWYFVE